MSYKNYNKGGGKDTGWVGELLSKLGVMKNQVSRTQKKLNNPNKQYRGQISEKEIEKIKKLKPFKGGR